MLGVLALLAGLLQTPYAKGRIARFIENNVSTAVVDKIEIGAITGTVPFNFQIKKVTLWDEGAPWLVVHDVAVDVARRPLLQRRVHVRNVSSALVELLALPVGEEQEEPWRLPELPELPRWLRIDRAVVDELRVSDAVAVEAGRFTGSAHFIPDPARRDIDIQARVERMDAPTTRAQAKVVLSEETLTLRAAASDSVFLPDLLGVDEPISFRVEGAGPLREWNGALEARLGDRMFAEATAALRGKTDVEVAGEGFLQLRPEFVSEAVREQLGDQVRFAVEGTLAEDGLLTLRSARAESNRAAVRASVSTHTEDHTLAGEVSVQYDDLREFAALRASEPVPVRAVARLDGTWTAQDWTLEADIAGERGAALEGQSRIDTLVAASVSGELFVPKALVSEAHWALTDDPVAVAVDARYNQQTGAVSLPEFTLGNRWASAQGRLESNPAEQKIAGRARVQLIDATLLQEVFAVDIDGTGSAEFGIDGDETGTAVSLHANFIDVQVDALQLSQLTAQGTFDAGPWPDDLWRNVHGELQAGTGSIRYAEEELPPLRLDAAAEQDEGGPIQLTRLRVTDDRMVLSGTGSIEADGAQAVFAVELEVPDLGPYAALVDQTYSGALVATSDISYDTSRAEAWQGTVDAAYRNAGGFPESIAPLMAQPVRLTAGGGFDGDRAVLEALTLAGGNWRVDVGGSYTLETERFDATAEIALEALEAANARASGTVRLNGSGRPDDFEANAAIELVDVAVGNAAVDGLRGAVLASGSTEAARVTAELTAATAGEAVSATALARVSGSAVDVPELSLRSGANVLDGRVEWNIDRGAGQGALTLDVPELDRIGRVTGIELGGSLSGDVRLAGPEDAPTLTADLTVADLAAPFGTLSEARLDATIRDVFARPHGRLEAELESLAAAGVAAGFATVHADFGGETIDAEVAASGLVNEAVPFETTARAVWNLDASSGSLDTLEGTFEEYAYALRSPVQVRTLERGFEIGSAAIAFGEGVVEVAGRVDNGALAFDARWDALPLEAGQLAGLPFSQGTLDGQLALRGTTDAPVGTATVDVRDARTPMMEEQGDSANLHVESELSGTTLSVNGSLEIPQSLTASITAVLPLMKSGDTVYALDERGAASGQLQLDADLASVPRLLALDAHVLAGRATADLALGGSISDPSLTGTLRMASARYENAELGTMLSNMQANLQASGDRIELEEFRADDGRGGTVTAEGAIEFTRLTVFSHRFDARLSDARLVHRDDFTGRVNGRLRFAGDQDGSELSGDVEVVEANIIFRPAPDHAIPDLEVRAVNAPAGYGVEPEASPRNPPENHPIRLSIEASMPGQVFVQAVDVFTEWNGAVQVSGTLNEPHVTGLIAPVRGYISFLGQRFTLQRESSIRVDTREQPSPVLNLIARTTRGGLEATLTLRGPLEEMSIDITSTPALPREEVLARVLFGRDMSEISPVQALQLARAVAMFSGTLEGVPFFSGPSRLPGIDTFDVETDGEEGPTVSVGKYLNEDIFVELEQGAGAETGRANVEFELTPNISVESSVGANTEGGLGILWKYDY